MASYRYERDIRPEDLIPDQPPHLLGRFVYARSRDLLKDSLRISLARPKAALIWVVGMALLPLLYGPVPNLFWYLFPLWLLIGGGLTITAAAFALRPAFAQLEQQH